MNRIEGRFRELRRQKRKAFITFITAGYPNLDTTRRLILEFAKVGVDIIELGVPFSDPLADGPIIQEASQMALKRGVNIGHILELVRVLRKDISIPICLMSYYNPIFCFGEERFIRQASASGVDGVIIPDLPPEEGEEFIRLSRRNGLATIFFLAPTSSDERIRLIASLSQGFIYYVSLTGVTGPRRNLSGDLIANVERIKKNTHKPVCVGFGLSLPYQVRQIYKIADGAIVGSAIINKIKENLNKKELVKTVGRYVFTLKDA